MQNKLFSKRIHLFLLPLLAGLALARWQQSAHAAPISSTDQSSAVFMADELDATELSDLLYMREEEKLAHDVYLALYEQWGSQVFSNIAASEQTHTSAVLYLLDSYGLADPVGTNAPGVFVNQDLQALYDELVGNGRRSLADAYRVGAAIEEIDIIDLDEAIASTSHADIASVYQRLRAGSENHLRAFVSNLERLTGQSYDPQYMEPADYAAIINDTSSLGNGNGRRGGSGSQRSGGNGRRPRNR